MNYIIWEEKRAFLLGMIGEQLSDPLTWCFLAFLGIAIGYETATGASLIMTLYMLIDMWDALLIVFGLLILPSLLDAIRDYQDGKNELQNGYQGVNYEQE